MIGVSNACGLDGHWGCETEPQSKREDAVSAYERVSGQVLRGPYMHLSALSMTQTMPSVASK